MYDSNLTYSLLENKKDPSIASTGFPESCSGQDLFPRAATVESFIAEFEIRHLGPSDLYCR